MYLLEPHRFLAALQELFKVHLIVKGNMGLSGQANGDLWQGSQTVAHPEESYVGMPARPLRREFSEPISIELVHGRGDAVTHDCFNRVTTYVQQSGK